MQEKVYVETTVISYLAAKPSRNIVIAGHQQVTHRWWNERRRLYRLIASQLVLNEASGGDPAAAERRCEILAELELLRITEDALHIGVAVTNGADYLLTWNCAHIANAVNRARVELLCHEAGYVPTTICTPDELAGDYL
jgi:hypothetical protein